jgi:hypothetical protein
MPIGRSLLAKDGVDFPPEVERAFQWFVENYGGAMEPIREDVIAAIQAGDIDPSALEGIRPEIQSRIGSYTNDIDVIYTDGVERGLFAGRELTVRRNQLDVAFDVVPQSTLDAFDAYASEATGEVLETLTDDVSRLIRGAHEEGLSIPDIADQVDDAFDNRFESWQAERTARTATISSSNAGADSAYRDSDAVVGKEWLATNDGRTRDAHSEADGQIVPYDGTFLVDGYEARYPGDPSLPVEQIANERCTTVAVFADQLTADELTALEAGKRIRV